MSEPVVTIEDVSRWYGEVIALNGATCRIGAGVTGLLGPNGSGKTTLIRLVTGQLRPSLGRVSVYGVDPWNSPELFRRLGYAPDAEALYDGMTGFGFIEFAARLAGYGAAEAERRAERALERMALSADGARRIGGYSKGMRQRLKLAQALIHEPELLILDEPLSGMDPVGRHRTIELVRDWGEAGGTVIVSSHILHEIEAMTRRILVLQDGRIRAEGDLHEIRDLMDRRPHHIALGVSEPRRVAAELLKWPVVDAVAIDEQRSTVVVQTRRVETFHRELPRLLLDSKVAVESIAATDDDLSAVFEYLTR